MHVCQHHLRRQRHPVVLMLQQVAHFSSFLLGQASILGAERQPNLVKTGSKFFVEVLECKICHQVMKHCLTRARRKKKFATQRILQKCNILNKGLREPVVIWQLKKLLFIKRTGYWLSKFIGAHWRESLYGEN